MGVPKLFKWICERYPLILRQLTSIPQPIIDNFYIDFNQIIHKMTHPPESEKDPTFSKSINEMINDICEYLSELISLVRPRKMVFIAIDGVAPMSKIRQQRERRFVSAQQRKQKKYQPKFDHNLISPGTTFMKKLNKNLINFIKIKIHTDSLWRRLKIIYSSHLVPGEGEHKILSYIRSMKETFSDTTSHAIYGQDADLFFLSLTIHEPNFCIFREKIDFKSFHQSSSILKLDIPIKENFEVVHIGLLRDYFKLEFSNKIEIEKVIDDIVLISFFIGNDFLPNLPNFDIKRGTLGNLFNHYKEFEGYLTHKGKLISIQVEKFLQTFKQIFQTPPSSKLKKTIPGFEMINSDSGVPYGKPGWELIYMENKFGSNSKELQNNLKKNYFEALNWNFYYYFLGCPDWSWYYQYPYSPPINLLTNLESIKINFNYSNEPINIYEQLLCILPPYSKEGLPKCLHPLLLNELSDLYSSNIILDINGKDYEWEFIALIPNIDFKKIRNSLINFPELLKKSSSSSTVIFKKSDSELINLKSKLFGNFNNLKVEINEFKQQQQSDNIYPELRQKYKIQFGFPSLRGELKLHFEKVGVNLFGYSSKNYSAVLSFINEPILRISSRCTIMWPFEKESQIIAIEEDIDNEEFKKTSDKLRKRLLEQSAVLVSAKTLVAVKIDNITRQIPSQLVEPHAPSLPPTTLLSLPTGKILYIGRNLPFAIGEEIKEIGIGSGKYKVNYRPDSRITFQKVKWFASHQIRQITQISHRIILRLSGKFLIDGKDIGLSIKMGKSKNLYRPGFSRISETEGWDFSFDILEFFQEYKKEFPELFIALESQKNERITKSIELFGDSIEEEPSKYILKIFKWIRKKKKLMNISQVPLCQLSYRGLHPLQIIELSNKRVPTETREYFLDNVSPDLIIIEGSLRGPELSDVYSLGLRVVHIGGEKAPFGAKGTIIGLDADRGFCDILFDEDFPGSSNIQGRCNTRRCSRLELINIINMSRCRFPRGHADIIEDDSSIQEVYGESKMNGPEPILKINSQNIQNNIDLSNRDISLSAKNLLMSSNHSESLIDFWNRIT